MNKQVLKVGLVALTASMYNTSAVATLLDGTATAEILQAITLFEATPMDFGAFVTILPGKDGLVHISQISEERVERVSDKLAEGDIIRVKVLEVDRQGRIRLSMRDIEAAACQEQ